METRSYARPKQRAVPVRSCLPLRGNGIQKFSAISKPGDIWEREADRAAQFVTAGKLAAGPSPARISDLPAVPPVVSDALRSPGQPLDPATRAFMEPRFSHDFSHVRVHSDSNGAELARALNARAFTVGHTIVFGAGEFAPTTASGKALLAHELTHVIQQRGHRNGAVPAVQFQKRPEKEEKKKEAPKVPADRERTKWRFHYASKAEAKGKFDFVKDLGLNPEEPFKEAEGWTFFYFPRTKDGAKADAAVKQKDLGLKHTVTAEFSELARSWFIKSILKCPEGIPEKKGFQVWPKCFSTQKEADALVKKFKGDHLNAETVSMAEAQKFGVYFQPLTEKEALAAGTAAAEMRPGFKEGMYTVKAAEKKELRSFTSSVSTACPTGFTDVGQFELTAYAFALESEFPKEPKIKDPCGLKGEFNQDFLFKTKGAAPLGVKMEGSGITRDGKIINWAPKGGKPCFAVSDCARTKIGECAKEGRTVAVDPSEIPLRSELLIEDIGARVAEDTGGAIKGKHIDIYYGAVPSSKANLLSFENKKVCKKKGR